MEHQCPSSPPDAQANIATEPAPAPDQEAYCTALLTAASTGLDNWVLDSGATQHMTSRADILTDIRPSKLRIKVAIGTHCYPCGHRFLDDQQYKWTPAYQAASYLTSSWHGSEPDLYFRSDPSWSSSHLQRHLR